MCIRDRFMPASTASWHDTARFDRSAVRILGAIIIAEQVVPNNGFS